MGDYGVVARDRSREVTRTSRFLLQGGVIFLKKLESDLLRGRSMKNRFHSRVFNAKFDPPVLQNETRRR